MSAALPFGNLPLNKAELKIIHDLRLKKHRDEFQLFVAEGDKCIGELISYFPLVCHLTPQNTPVSTLERLSSLRSPQGSLAVFKQRITSLQEIDYSDLVLVLDGIQDPGNMGTILRTCDGFGVHDVVCSDDTVDVYSHKVVQATMGAFARVRTHYVRSLPDYLKDVRVSQPHLPVYGTLLDGKNMYAEDALPSRRQGILIMGNEGNGISPAVRSCITNPLFIPPFANKTVESLNVGIATAIVLSYFRQPI